MSEYELIIIITSIVSVVISLAVSIISIYNIVLLKRNSLRTEDITKADVLMKVSQAHRKLFIDIINDETLLQEISTDTSSNTKSEMVGTFLINHANGLYLYSKTNMLFHEDWESIKKDMQDMFMWPVVKTRWDKVKQFYSKDFQNFIDGLYQDNEIVQEQITLKTNTVAPIVENKEKSST